MGALSQARENPYRAQGLLPGLPLRIQVQTGDGVETLATRVEDVNDERLVVLVPMQRLRQRPLPPSAVVRCEYFFRGRRWRFATEVRGTSADGQHQLLAIPAGIEDSDRRSYFRLSTALQPISVYRLVLDRESLEADPETSLACTVVDLSEGGVCLSSKTRATVGDWLGIHLDLPLCGEIKARMRVVAVDPPPPGNRNYRIHCVFSDISRADRDRIARFLMRRQLEMRRRGQL